jgi:hypothetical protein
MRDNRIFSQLGFHGSDWVRSALSDQYILTLPGLKTRGSLIHRPTLKCSVLVAMLKPFNRGMPPIDEPNSEAHSWGLSPKAY